VTAHSATLQPAIIHALYGNLSELTRLFLVVGEVLRRPGPVALRLRRSAGLFASRIDQRASEMTGDSMQNMLYSMNGTDSSLD
jgi:hypothetical protein